MKSRIKANIIFLLILSQAISGCISIPVTEETQLLIPLKVGLDPGHGWTENRVVASGAVGNGLQEKDVNVDIALRTKAILESNGFQVVMTRTGDDQHDLSWAAFTINEQNPNIVVSIHTNGGVSSATGTEACYTVGKSTDTESQALAQLLTDSVSTKLALRNRGIFPENSGDRCARTNSTGWSQLYIHDMNPPVALIETAFISNPSDADLLKNRSQDFAQAIADAVMAYFQTKGFVIAGPQGTPPSIGVTIEAATVSPQNTNQIHDVEIAYMGTDKFGNQIDIRLIRSDGSNIITVPLDNSAPDEYIPTHDGIKFSPNGKFIAFGRSKYTNYGVDTSDGTVFVKVPSGPKELVVVDLSIGKIITVINSFENAFDWSPDSLYILHNREFEWSTDFTKPINNEGLWMTDIYTGEDIQLIPPIKANPIVAVKWSPDGIYIAFHEATYEGYGPFGIMKSDGSNIISWKNQVGEFDWSPDGREIVFDERLYSLEKGMRLFIANPDGSNQRILFEDQNIAATHPRWSPDGRFIAFLAAFDDWSPKSLWIIEASGKNLHQLTSTDLESIEGMSWSPDSNKLLVSAKNGLQIYVISLDGENFYLGQGLYPVWRP